MNMSIDMLFNLRRLKFKQVESEQEIRDMKQSKIKTEQTPKIFSLKSTFLHLPI